MFLISKSDFINLCKSMGKDPEFEKLRAEVLSILKKQAKAEGESDRKEIHKSLEEMDKSFKYFDKDDFIVKSGYPVGTIREWKGKKYIKIAPNKWKPKYDSESKGAKNSITRLMNQVEKCKSVEELMNLVMANKQRFTDANGNHLPIVDKLRAAADKKNDALSSGKTSDLGNKIDSIYEKQLKRINQLRKQGKSDEEIGNDNVVKQTKADMKKINEKLDGKKEDTKGEDSEEDVLSKYDKDVKQNIDQHMMDYGGDKEKVKNRLASVYVGNPELFQRAADDADFRKYYNLMNGTNLSKDDCEKKLEDSKQKLQSFKKIMKLSDEEISKYKKEAFSDYSGYESYKEKKNTKKNEKINSLATNFANQLELLSKEERKKALEDVIKRKGTKSAVGLAAKMLLESDFTKDIEESEAEKHKNRSDAMKGNKNAYKGGPDEVSKYINGKTNDFKKRDSMLADALREKYGIDENGKKDSFELMGDLYSKVKTSKPHTDGWYDALNKYDEAAKIYHSVNGGKDIDYYNSEIEKERMKPNYNRDEVVESKKENQKKDTKPVASSKGIKSMSDDELETEHKKVVKDIDDITKENESIYDKNSGWNRGLSSEDEKPDSDYQKWLKNGQKLRELKTKENDLFFERKNRNNKDTKEPDSNWIKNGNDIPDEKATTTWKRDRKRKQKDVENFLGVKKGLFEEDEETDIAETVRSVLSEII